MNELIKIADQQFYYSTIDKGFESFSQKENCAIIIDENYFVEFLKNADDFIGSNINQLIIISESVHAVLDQLEGVNVLLVAAVSFEDAVRLAILGEALSKEVVCVPKEDIAFVTKVLSNMSN